MPNEGVPGPPEALASSGPGNRDPLYVETESALPEWPEAGLSTAANDGRPRQTEQRSRDDAPTSRDEQPATQPLPAVELENRELPAISRERIGAGEAAWISIPCPGKTTGNEDTVAVIPVSPRQGLLAVADGLGGHRGGRHASQSLIRSLKKAVRSLSASDSPGPLLISRTLPIPCQAREGNNRPIDLRPAVLDQIERTNQRLLRRGQGAGTTLALVETDGHRVRTYHIGDSDILVLSQRGRIKYQTIGHSPVSYAVQSGLLSEEEALLHEDRHLVSNIVGCREMSIELGPWIPLKPRDTVLLASDGLFDNLMLTEIIDRIRKGKLAEGVKKLAELATERMTALDLSLPSKPDDLTILAFRRR
jgi:PPM family protein phosphatase